MSWLSELFGGGDDNSAEIARQQNAFNYQQQQMLQQQQAQQSERDREFQLQMARLLKPPEPAAPPPKTPEELAAEQEAATQRQREGYRTTQLGAVNSLFAPEFEQGLISNTFDDPYIADMFKKQRGKGEDYLNRLLSRGVVTQTGYQGGLRKLEEQDPRVRTQLGDIGNLLLEQERSGQRDIANRARGTASTLDIGQAFDPSVYGGQSQQRFGEFQTNFGDRFASQIPGDLFDLSTLGPAAGSAQGPQNLPLTPAVGEAAPEETEEQKKKRTSTVF